MRWAHLPRAFGAILIPMSRLQVLVLLVLVGVVAQPFSGLDCSPRGAQRLPCCDEPAAGCPQVGNAAACCQGAPASSDSGAVVAARPQSRPDDVLVIVAAQATALAPPALAAAFGGYARRPVESPPRPPAVLRL